VVVVETSAVATGAAEEARRVTGAKMIMLELSMGWQTN
jgi:hypothetical protein